MKKRIYLFFALFAMCAISACKKKETQQPVDPPKKVVDVYITGSYNGMAVYWKNGTMIKLDSLQPSGAGPIKIVGNDLYIAGFTKDAATGSIITEYWKNGVATRITDNTVNTYPSDLLVYGTDVYISLSIYALPLHVGIPKPTYWKNGVVTELSATQGSAGAMAISGNDFYISGDIINSGNKTVACYWKNGAINLLSDGTSYASAGSIAIMGNDVYVSGSDKNNTSYWKNGVPVSLEGVDNYGDPLPAFGGAITFSGNDMYIAGTANDGLGGLAEYWKNGVAVPLNYSHCSATGIAISDNDVYVIGYNADGNGLYWENGILKSGPSPDVVYGGIAISEH